jgi:hypothetical protein
MLFSKITIRLNRTPFQNQQVIKGLSISLLNTDIKIASAALANRLRPVLPFIISDTQKGFMKDRFMGENTRHRTPFQNQQVIKGLSYYFPQDSALHHIKGVCSHP